MATTATLWWFRNITQKDYYDFVPRFFLKNNCYDGKRKSTLHLYNYGLLKSVNLLQMKNRL